MPTYMGPPIKPALLAGTGIGYENRGEAGNDVGATLRLDIGVGLTASTHPVGLNFSEPSNVSNVFFGEQAGVGLLGSVKASNYTGLRNHTLSNYTDIQVGPRIVAGSPSINAYFGSDTSILDNDHTTTVYGGIHLAAINLEVGTPIGANHGDSYYAFFLHASY